MNALKDQMCYCSGQRSFFRFDQIHVFRTDYNIDGLVCAKALIHAGKLLSEDGNKLIADHDAVDDVGVSDEVCNESILRLIVDLFRRADLLNVALVHNNDGIGHGQSFFLVMSDIDECDAELIFQTDQLILHVLAQL